MSIETGVLVNLKGEPIYWHLPEGRNAGYLPDSRNLWDVIWENRNDLLGFAHSHPGSGRPGPSYEDVTTFSAIEIGLGRRLTWWICSIDGFVEVKHHAVIGCDPQYRYSYYSSLCDPSLSSWLEELRRLSY